MAAPPIVPKMRSNNDRSPVAPAPDAAPQIVINNYAAAVQVEPEVSEGRVALMIYSANRENNVSLPSILGAADKRSS
ncbi:hypothetical protein [Methylocystis sp. ATCC 49242]|uniref:hypothetical protein n=1 Tax=Methylocystis sp. ATCC 49242 TaxID=622637 RepID=UPI0002F40C8C|nr:hypothetical protein [Methylocystis sp. ATCC 49242]